MGKVVNNMDRRELLFNLATDAFDVLNWARREGHKRDKQLEQVVEAFEKTLTDSNVRMKPYSEQGAEVGPCALEDIGKTRCVGKCEWYAAMKISHEK